MDPYDRLPIGGYHALTLPRYPLPGHLAEAASLNSGRNALLTLLEALMPERREVWIPEYYCPEVTDALARAGYSPLRYAVSPTLEPILPAGLPEGTVVVAVNYSGIMDAAVERFAAEASKVGVKVVADNCQALMTPPPAASAGAFYSPRKFVGLPDGGFAALPSGTLKPHGMRREETWDRCTHLLQRIDCDPGSGLDAYRANERLISTLPPRLMSRLSRRLFEAVDADLLTEKGRKGFMRLHEVYGRGNLLPIADASSFRLPLCYPLLTDDMQMRERLRRRGIFTPVYWPGSTTPFPGLDLIPLPLPYD